MKSTKQSEYVLMPREPSDEMLACLTHEWVSAGAVSMYENYQALIALVNKQAKPDSLEAQLQATFDEYCKQFEPIYQIIYSDGLIQDVTKIHYDAIDAIKRIVYLSPQQIQSEVKAYIERLEKALKCAHISVDKFTSGDSARNSDIDCENCIANALASKPDCLKE